MWNETVTLTAQAWPGFGFQMWGGDGSGSTDAVVVSMTGHKSISAVFTNTAPCQPVPVVTNMTLTSLYNNATRWQGMRFQVGENPIQVTALGRYCVSNNTQSHSIKLIDVALGDVVAEAQWTPSGAAGQFVYADCPPTALLALGTYDLICQEFIG